MQEVNYRVMPNPPCKRLELFIAPGRFGNPWVSHVKCLG